METEEIKKNASEETELKKLNTFSQDTEFYYGILPAFRFREIITSPELLTIELNLIGEDKKIICNLTKENLITLLEQFSI